VRIFKCFDGVCKFRNWFIHRERVFYALILALILSALWTMRFYHKRVKNIAKEMYNPNDNKGYFQRVVDNVDHRLRQMSGLNVDEEEMA